MKMKICPASSSTRFERPVAVSDPSKSVRSEMNRSETEKICMGLAHLVFSVSSFFLHVKRWYQVLSYIGPSIDETSGITLQG